MMFMVFTRPILFFWLLLSVRGEEVVKARCSKAKFYRLRKRLADAGVSWKQMNIHILPDQDTALPRGFIPTLPDPRRCVGKISANSVFAFRPFEEMPDDGA